MYVIFLRRLEGSYDNMSVGVAQMYPSTYAPQVMSIIAT